MVQEETGTDRKSRVAELAKAIKAKKTDISKKLESVNTEVKKNLTVQESVRRTRTVQEEVERQVKEETQSTAEVEETRGKTGVIRRRAKNPPPGVVAREVTGERPVVREPEPEPEPAPVVKAKAPVVEPEPVVVREPEPEPEPEPVVAREPEPEPEPAPVVREPEPAPVRPVAREPERAPTPMVAAPSVGGTKEVVLIKRGGKDVTPAGLTFTPNQPVRPPSAPRAAGDTTPDRGAPVPGTERKGKQVFELKEMTFGPGQLQGGRRKRVIPKKAQQKTQITTPKAIKKRIAIEGGITVGALAQRMAVKVGDVMKKLMGMGMMATMNQTIDADTATLVAAEFGFEVSNVEFKEEEILGTESAEDVANSRPRPPVVTIMGHVDHGKTSLLDSIRKANVAGGEAGGITQHIGAYQIKVADGKLITFLDTPGHEAFTAMRARGAEVTDIVILVCAIDDGPQPQTIEAINHAKAAGVPIIVALNKADKPGVDPEKLMQKFTEYQLVPEEWGGDTMFVKTSAKTGLGIQQLLDAILLRAEVDELKANPVKPAVGAIVEAKIDKGRGPVATVLVQEGTLRLGDAIVAGPYYGKIRAMTDDKGKAVKEAPPSTPVEVLGLNGVPDAGDSLNVAADLEAAKQVAEHRTAKARETALGGGTPRKVSMEQMFSGSSGSKELNVIVKADVQGSVQALSNALEKLSTEKVKVHVVSGSVGTISESDVQLAVASKAIIVGFNVKPDNRGRELSDQEHIDVRSYSIIYEALDEVKKSMIGLLDPILREAPLGKAEVRARFDSKIGAVAGCAVVDGKISRKAKVRVVRANKVLFEGKIASLKRIKDDVSEVSNGMECGIVIEGFGDVQAGDEIHCYTIEEITPTLD